MRCCLQMDLTHKNKTTTYVKKITIVVIALLLLASILYTASYRRPDYQIYAVSLLKDNHALYIPRTQLTCKDSGACTVHLNEEILQIEVTFQPANSPFGQCRASYGATLLPCHVKQRYYYRFGDTMRAYLVISDRADEVQLTGWQLVRFRLETILASLALGDSEPWIYLAGVTALGIGWGVYQPIWKIFWRPASLPAGTYWQNGTAILISLAATLFVAGAAWFFLLFLLFISGIMVD